MTRRTSLKIGLGTLLLFLLTACATSTGKGGAKDAGTALGKDAEPVVSVLLQSPPCDVQRVGTVEAEVGLRVTEHTSGPPVPPVRSRAALAKLAEAAHAAGGNAVVLRHRQGVHFTYHGRRSGAPVFIRLGGGAILLPDDISDCRLVHVDPDVMDRDLRDRKPTQTTSGRAYAD